MIRNMPHRCLLCDAAIPRRAGRRPKFCSTLHRVTYHRRLTRGSSVNAWRRQHQPRHCREMCRADLQELALAWAELPAGPSGRTLADIARRASDLLEILDRSEELAWALECEHAEYELFDLRDDLGELSDSRAILEKLRDLDELVGEVVAVSACWRKLRQGAEAIEVVLSAGEGG